jgi:hypothetical protein
MTAGATGGLTVTRDDPITSLLNDMDPVTSLLVTTCSALVIALIAAAIWPRRWLLTALIVGCSFPAYVMAYGLVSGANLWPIAGGLWWILTMPPAFLGAGVGEMIGRRRRPRRPATPVAMVSADATSDTRVV